jgi:hypothetical protein
MTFTARIEQSQSIKNNTQKLFLDKFKGKLDENNVIIPTVLPSNAYHGARRTGVVMESFEDIE